MNKLEERIFEALNSPEAYKLMNRPGYAYEEYQAKVVASIVLEISEKSYRKGTSDQFMGLVSTSERDYFEEFKKELLE